MTPETLILLHGALGTETQFDRLKTALEPHFDVHVFTFEGHGGVLLTGTFGISTFLENVQLYMNDHQLEKASFFGFSMGGYVALKMASLHPEKVEKVITYGTKFDWTPEFSAGEVRKLNPGKIVEKVPHFAQHLASVHAPLDWKKVVNDTAEMMTNLGTKNELTEAIFKTISQPTLVLLGELDQMATLEESKAVADFLPNGTFEMIDGFEHQIEKVDQEVLAKRIGLFLLG